jgi:hypothetical protein
MSDRTLGCVVSWSNQTDTSYSLLLLLLLLLTSSSCHLD